MATSDFSQIKLLILDVDGVLTDGGIFVHDDGTESKRFDVMDGHRIKMWHRAGGRTAIISGRDTPSTDHRAWQLDISCVMQGSVEKLPAFEELLNQMVLTPDQTAYIGDDIMDIPLVRRAGFGVAVANAAEDLKKCADYVTTQKGGHGAVGEVIEYLLKKSGKWDALMERYRV
jgi:3-deoxy-D-manno-octulosonate 8-phosphate phosphatase (KDO 8-P phosphatase)